MRALARTLPPLLAVLAACGTQGADLMLVERAGTIEGAALRLRLFDDGGVECNGGERRALPSGLLIEAREIARELEPLAGAGLSLRPRPGSTLRYRIRTEQGRVAFADTSGGQPRAFFRAAQLVRRVAQDACGLER